VAEKEAFPLAQAIKAVKMEGKPITPTARAWIGLKMEAEIQVQHEIHNKTLKAEVQIPMQTNE